MFSCRFRVDFVSLSRHFRNSTRIQLFSLRTLFQVPCSYFYDPLCEPRVPKCKYHIKPQETKLMAEYKAVTTFVKLTWLENEERRLHDRLKNFQLVLDFCRAIKTSGAGQQSLRWSTFTPTQKTSLHKMSRVSCHRHSSLCTTTSDA